MNENIRTYNFFCDFRKFELSIIRKILCSHLHFKIIVQTEYDIEKNITKFPCLPVPLHPELYDIGQGQHERGSVFLSDASPTGRYMPVKD